MILGENIRCEPSRGGHPRFIRWMNDPEVIQFS
jgi:hypothetical protein